MVAPKRPRPAADRALWVGARAHYEDAAYYSKTYGRRLDDVQFYEALGRQHRGPLLEYGIGNGRIALPLARLGCSVTGIDWSPTMLADLRQRLEAEKPAVRRRIALAEGDMREVRLKKKFPLVLCTFNTFLHLYTRSDVEQFLAGVRSHLSPGGRFVFDVAIPQPGDLDRDPNRAYSAPRFRHPSTGQMVRYTERFDYDASRQILFVTMEFLPVDGGESWVVPLAHRQFFPQEIEALLHYNGLEVEEVRADFGDEPLSRFSDVAVWTARLSKALGSLAPPEVLGVHFGWIATEGRRQALSACSPARARRHGRGVRSHRPALQPQGGGQGAGQLGRRRSARRRGPLRARGEGRQRHRLRQHRARPRRRHRRGLALHGDGAGARPRPAPLVPPAQADAPRGRDPHRGPGLQRAGARPRRRRHSPRHQARQHLPF